MMDFLNEKMVQQHAGFFLRTDQYLQVQLWRDFLQKSGYFRQVLSYRGLQNRSRVLHFVARWSISVASSILVARNELGVSLIVFLQASHWDSLFQNENQLLTPRTKATRNRKIHYSWVECLKCGSLLLPGNKFFVIFSISCFYFWLLEIPSPLQRTVIFSRTKNCIEYFPGLFLIFYF